MKKIILALLLMFGLGMMANATGMQGEKKRGGLFSLIKQLDLSTEQKQEFKALKQERKASRKAHKLEMKSKRRAMGQPDMSSFMSAKTFDKVAFKKEMTKRFDAREKTREARRDTMLEKRAEGMQKIFNILTPKQRKKLIELSKSNK